MSVQCAGEISKAGGGGYTVEGVLKHESRKAATALWQKTK